MSTENIVNEQIYENQKKVKNTVAQTTMCDQQQRLTLSHQSYAHGLSVCSTQLNNMIEQFEFVYVLLSANCSFMILLYFYIHGNRIPMSY